MYLEAISKLSVVALGPEIGDGKTPCAGNSGAISKRGNAASADFRAQPVGPGRFLCISALFVAHGHPVNHTPLSPNCTNITPGATADNFETAS